MSCSNLKNGKSSNCSFLSSCGEGMKAKNAVHIESASHSYNYSNIGGKITTKEDFSSEKSDGKNIEKYNKKMKNGSGKEIKKISTDGGKTFKTILEKVFKKNTLEGKKDLNKKIKKSKTKVSKKTKK